VESHNSKSTKSWTRSFRPWIVIHVEVFQTRSEALKREKNLKSGKGREWIRNKILPNYL
ncbi:MAG: GIY-YIG nuclease family protein, partial [Flavobacteriaceae bacterium]